MKNSTESIEWDFKRTWHFYELKDYKSFNGGIKIGLQRGIEKNYTFNFKEYFQSYINSEL